MTTQLARVRNDLVSAIAADSARSRRRRRIRLSGLAAAAVLAVGGTSVAATTGLFAPAPDSVKGTFEELDGPNIDASRAVRIGVIDDHAAYAAPTEDGGFCLYFAPNPRSGPSGSTCTDADAGAGEILLTVSVGSDGGFVFGRVGGENAATVEIRFPNAGGTLTAPVAEERFFLAGLSDRAMRALTVELPVGPKDPPTKHGGPIRAFDQSRIDAITAAAKDAQGNTLARGTPVSLPDPGMPTETGPGPGH